MAVVSLRSDEFTLDPYDTYAYMREQEPVLWDDETATWYVARFADVYGLLGSPALAARGVMSWVEDLEPREREIVEPVEEFFAAWPVFSNRPDHEVLRQALLTSLGRSALRTLEEPLERWTRQICSGFAPGDDIVTGFARPLGIRSLSNKVPIETAVGTVAQFLTGAVEPTTTAIVIATHGLSQNAALREALSDGFIGPGAVVEEALRFDPAFHFAPRVARETFSFQDHVIRSGERVNLVLASANRDERRWERAAEFDPLRQPRTHLAFGRGGHACLGAALARLQTSTAVSTASEGGLLDAIAACDLVRIPSFGGTALRRLSLFGD